MKFAPKPRRFDLAQRHSKHLVHNIICQHQIGVEVWPDKAEVYFRDERYSNPVNTQMRFDAVVYNARNNKVTWQVEGLNGMPAAGSIDETGLYQAPIKGGLYHGITERVVVSVVDDPLRSAYALVTLVGEGPAPAPEPRIDLLPSQANLYYKIRHHNAYIDNSNKIQLFKATIRNNSSSQVNWYVNNTLVSGHTPWYLYQAPNEPNAATAVPTIVKIRAEIAATPLVYDEAIVILDNYSWPGI